MKHLSTITRAHELPAKAINIPEDVIRAIQDVDPLEVALEIVRIYVEMLTSGEKTK